MILLKISLNLESSYNYHSKEALSPQSSARPPGDTLPLARLYVFPINSSSSVKIISTCILSRVLPFWPGCFYPSYYILKGCISGMLRNNLFSYSYCLLNFFLLKACMHACTCMYLCTFLNVCVCTHVCICVHVCVCVCAYTCVGQRLMLSTFFWSPSALFLGTKSLSRPGAPN